jgi:hypothetical protein
MTIQITLNEGRTAEQQTLLYKSNTKGLQRRLQIGAADVLRVRSLELRQGEI